MDSKLAQSPGGSGDLNTAAETNNVSPLVTDQSPT